MDTIACGLVFLFMVSAYFNPIGTIVQIALIYLVLIIDRKYRNEQDRPE